MASNDEYQQAQQWVDKWVSFYINNEFVYSIKESKLKQQAADYEKFKGEIERKYFFNEINKTDNI